MDMPERLLKTTDVAWINLAEQRFGIPAESVTVIKSGLMVPIRPIFYFADEYFACPPYQVADRQRQAQEKWKDLSSGVSYLLKQHTTFRYMTTDLVAEAAKAFSAGVFLADEFPEAKILLPPNIGFDPVQTEPVEKSLSVGVKFSANSWQPGAWSEAPNRVDLRQAVHFGLTLETDSNSRHFDLAWRGN